MKGEDVNTQQIMQGIKENNISAYQNYGEKKIQCEIGECVNKIMQETMEEENPYQKNAGNKRIHCECISESC